MAQRFIKWTRTAEIQYLEILEYWVNRNKSTTYARKLIKKIAERTKQIAEKPFIFKKADFKDTRVSSLGNFSIFYQVADEAIVITAFWDNRQDPEKLSRIILKDKP